MFRNTLSRPFYSYVVTQSALVLIVLAASYLLTFLVFEHFGIELDRLIISLALIVAAQLPVAVVYARREGHEIAAGEGWALAFVFVGVTLIGETALQALSGELLASVGVFSHLAHGAMADSLVAAVCGAFAAVLFLVSAAKILFRLAVTCHLRQRSIATASSFGLRRPKVSQDFSELYRRELIGANIAVFGLALAVFGPEFLIILKLSLPMSLVFAVICVASRLARTETRVSLSARCLHISVQLMPLTVTCLVLLGLGELYTQYAAHADTAATPLGYVAVASAGLMVSQSALTEIAIVLGLIFSLALAANTLMLVLFTRLIRPLVSRTVKASGMAPPVVSRTQTDLLTGASGAEACPAAFVKASEILAAFKQRKTQTARPCTAMLEWDQQAA